MNNYPDNHIYIQSKHMDFHSSIYAQADKEQITLQHLLEGIQQGAWQTELEQYRQLLKQANRATVKQQLKALKLKLPAASLSGTFGTSKEESLLQHSGLLQIDIDLKTTADSEQFYELYRSTLCLDPFMIAVFDSPSFGIKGIFHLGICKDKEQHKELAMAAHQYLRETYCIEERLLDASTLNLGRKCSVSYDAELYCNYSAADFSQSDLVSLYLENIRSSLLTRSNAAAQTVTELESFSCTAAHRRIAQSLLQKACAAITSAQEGKRFETRRRNAFKLGGYALYLEEHTALSALVQAAQSNCSSKEKAKRDVLSAFAAGKQKLLKIELRSKSAADRDPAEANTQQQEIAEFYPVQQNIHRTVIPKGSYLSELLTKSHFRKSTLTNLVASTGSGKMFAIAEIQQRIAERVIYVSPLVRLVEQAKQDLRAVGYTDGVKRIPDANIFATTINSLCTSKLGITQLLKEVRKERFTDAERNLTLVLDEVHEIAEKLFEQGCETNYPEFVEFCRNYVSRIITLTATETSFSRAFTEQLSKDLHWQQHSAFFAKTAEKIRLKHLSLPRNEILPQLLELIEQRQPKRSLIILQSKEKTERLAKALIDSGKVEEDDICLVNADRDTVLDQQAKFIIGSPSLAIGISFRSEIELFVLVTEDSIFQPHDLEQYSARIRNPEQTEFLLITQRHKKESHSSYQQNLRFEQYCLSQLEQSINEEIETSRVLKEREHMVRMLDYDAEQQRWSIHPLYQMLLSERSAFQNFCVAHGAAAFVKYLQQQPFADYSFVIEDFREQLQISAPTAQLSKQVEAERKQEKILNFEQTELLQDIRAHQAAREELKSLQMQDPPEHPDEREEYLEQKAKLPLQLKKMEAHLLGIDTTGLDLQRCRECVSKSYRYASLLSLITMTQLPQAELLYRRMLTRWATEDYLNKLCVAPKWTFAKQMLEILRMKDGFEEQQESLREQLKKLPKARFLEVFALKSSEQNQREVFNKLSLLLTDAKLAWQSLGVDYRVYRDVLTELKGSADVAGDLTMVKQLIEQQEQLGQCSDSTELRHWYNQFMRFLKQHWSTLNEYQSVNWTNAERKRKIEEAVEEEQHREVAEQLKSLRSRKRLSAEKKEQPIIFFN